MDKILLIVDPQVDFISGSLAVEGAKEKMDALASALQNGEIDCDYVMVTKDYATVDDILSRFIPFENFRKSKSCTHMMKWQNLIAGHSYVLDMEKM